MNVLLFKEIDQPPIRFEDAYLQADGDGEVLIRQRIYPEQPEVVTTTAIFSRGTFKWAMYEQVYEEIREQLHSNGA